MGLNEINLRLLELDAEKAKLLKLRKNLMKVPNKVMGWNVTQTKPGYYKLFKRIDKKKVGIHHGKIWNEKRARQQIRRKEMDLGHNWSKLDIAIDYLQRNEPKKLGYFLAFSGGKDSIVMMDVVKKSGVQYTPYFCATGIDPPEVMQFIRKHYPEVIWVKPKISFWDAIVKNGYPTRRSRWCCRVLKEDATKHIPLKRRLVGVRKEESFQRAQRAKTSKVDNNITHYKPIFEWNEADIWEHITEHNLSYPSLYDEGWGRVGCVVCPFITEKNSAMIARNRKKWPGMYKAFEHAMYRLWDDRQWWRERKLGYNILFEDFIAGWYDGFQK